MNIIEAYEKGLLIQQRTGFQQLNTECAVTIFPESIIATDWEIITPRPPKRIKKSWTVWLNCYANGRCACHGRKEDADLWASPDRISCKPFTYEWFEDENGNVVEGEV